MKGFVSGEGFPGLEVVGDIWRGWIVPVGGSTPDRHKDDRHFPAGSEIRRAAFGGDKING